MPILWLVCFGLIFSAAATAEENNPQCDSSATYYLLNQVLTIMDKQDSAIFKYRNLISNAQNDLKSEIKQLKSLIVADDKNSKDEVQDLKNECQNSMKVTVTSGWRRRTLGKKDWNSSGWKMESCFPTKVPCGMMECSISTAKLTMRCALSFMWISCVMIVVETITILYANIIMFYKAQNTKKYFPVCVFYSSNKLHWPYLKN
ncbi:Hypothetical predicted protein [Cloeon dipterum]|uniref:Uncharacterized protein n=1 Tax=Cloeon dipterum TaxID=197152 RepID=A0A8S1D618_9INSE|nr:Hypothetical predicted protein [Cloeon dipterum]